MRSRDCKVGMKVEVIKGRLYNFNQYCSVLDVNSEEEEYALGKIGSIGVVKEVSDGLVEISSTSDNITYSCYIYPCHLKPVVDVVEQPLEVSITIPKVGDRVRIKTNIELLNPISRYVDSMKRYEGQFGKILNNNWGYYVITFSDGMTYGFDLTSFDVVTPEVITQDSCNTVEIKDNNKKPKKNVNKDLFMTVAAINLEAAYFMTTKKFRKLCGDDVDSPSLIDMFNWYNSPQGFDFWNTICKSIK